MKKILVCSDSHRDSGALLRAVGTHKPDKMWFLGDGLADLSEVYAEYPGLPVTAVYGNNDFWDGAAEELLITEEGKLFLLNHGARYRVKSGLSSLLKAASQKGVYAACFGHTHIPEVRFERGIWLVNPGSVSQWRGTGSCATITFGSGPRFTEPEFSVCGI